METPQSVLNAKIRSNFITIPQTTIDYEKLHERFTQYKQLTYVLTKLEHHEDEGLHIHVVVKSRAQIKIKQLEYIIMSQEGTIGGCINYQTPENIVKCCNYLKKTESAVKDKPYLETGIKPRGPGKPSGKYEDDQQLLTAMETAESGDIDGALDIIKYHDPKLYIQHHNTLKTNLETMNNTTEYYELPDMSQENVKLTTCQQKVWDLLQNPPITRRIIWVSGEYGSGKTFLSNYINENHKMRCYNAGQSASLDNVVYGYDQEGVIMWDLPRTYKFDEYGDSLANVIEKFSDFGTVVSSKKYSGKTTRVRGHAVVFSNQEPIKQLLHRDVVHIHMVKPQPIRKKKRIIVKRSAVRSEATSECSDAPQTIDLST